MSEGRSLDEKKHQIEGLANAQTIRKTLEALEEGRTRFVSRWLYELIQNARDSFDRNRRLQIGVRISPHEIIFRHNGRPFSDEEILSLIVHGSTKRDLQDSPIRFGTGF
jgi:cell division inhibitor SulA